MQAVEVFEDTTGIYRTFDPSTVAAKQTDDLYSSSTTSSAHGKANGAAGRSTASLVSSSAQIQHLVASEPSISATIPIAESALHTGRGSMWLVTMSGEGAVAIRGLPDGEVVFESRTGLGDSVPSFEDDFGDAQGMAPASAGVESALTAGRKGKGKKSKESVDIAMEEGPEDDEEDEQEEGMDEVEQMMFHSLGKGHDVRPHLFVSLLLWHGVRGHAHLLGAAQIRPTQYIRRTAPVHPLHQLYLSPCLGCPLQKSTHATTSHFFLCRRHLCQRAWSRLGQAAIHHAPILQPRGTGRCLHYW